MLPRFQGATVVVTGASSGIGRATALTFARHGARLVLAARRAEALADVATECQQLGAAALAVPTDVMDAEAMQRLAQTAYVFGGRIDVWVNNAAIGAMGPFWGIPLATHEQVLHTNLFGYLYGAYAVLPYFRAQQSGTLINVNSLGAWLPEPYSCSYNASKSGLRGLMDSLRTELSDEPAIHVCDVHPAFTARPGYQAGADNAGHLIEPAQPVFPAQKVADAILALAQHPRECVMVGWTEPAQHRASELLPGVTHRLELRTMRRFPRQAPQVPVAEGSLFSSAPAPYGNSSFGRGKHSSSPHAAHKWLGAAFVAGLAASLLAWGPQSQRAA